MGKIVSAITPRRGNLKKNNLSGQHAIDPIRVAICDQSPTIRNGLQHIFGTAPDIDIVLVGSSQAEVLSKSDGLDIDVILVDISDEMLAGIKYLNKFREKIPDAKVMILTGGKGCRKCWDKNQIIEAVEMGVESIQCKREAEADEIISAVRTVQKGGKILAPSCVNEALLSFQFKTRVKLSEREQEVLDLITMRISNNDIAEKLNISVHTFYIHMHSILSKLDAKKHANAELRLH